MKVDPKISKLMAQVTRRLRKQADQQAKKRAKKKRQEIKAARNYSKAVAIRYARKADKPKSMMYQT